MVIRWSLMVIQLLLNSHTMVTQLYEGRLLTGRQRAGRRMGRAGGQEGGKGGKVIQLSNYRIIRQLEEMTIK
ncbi:MAG: hypothetical protein HXX13_15480, partial [Bacteroidetes bacterium]|nr:hypothetical protein [Bacteroidota bacterium]